MGGWPIGLVDKGTSQSKESTNVHGLQLVGSRVYRLILRIPPLRTLHGLSIVHFTSPTKSPIATDTFGWPKFLDSTRSIQSNYGEIFIHKRYFFL